MLVVLSLSSSRARVHVFKSGEKTYLNLKRVRYKKFSPRARRKEREKQLAEEEEACIFTMDAAAFSALSRELCSSSLSSHEKTTLFITEVASKEKKISCEQLGMCLKNILFVNFRLRCCTETATYITDWEKNREDLKRLVKKWEFTDFEEAIEEERKRSGGQGGGNIPGKGGEGREEKNNRTLAAWSRKIEMEEKDEEDEDDATTLPLAVEERKSGVNGNGYNNEEEDLKQSAKETDDPTWMKPLNAYETKTAARLTETKRVGVRYEHFDKKKNVPLVELRVERDVPTFREDFNTIAYDEDFTGDVILDVKNEFKTKGGVKVFLKCNEYGHWESGSGKHRKTHTRRKTSYSKEFNLLSLEDQNRTFREGERIVLRFKFDEIIDAPSFYFGGGRTTCYVKWQFGVYLDVDYGNAFKNAFGRDVDFKCDCHHVGKYLSISANKHLGTPTDRKISVSVPSFMCCGGSKNGDLEGRVWLERDHFSVADDVWRNQALRSALQMQLKNSSKKEIQNARYEFRRSISIAGHCFSDYVVSSGYFPQSFLKPEMMSFENFNFQLSVTEQGGLSFANQATSPPTNYARIEWKLVVIFKVNYAFDPKIVFPITLCSRFVA